MERKTTRYRRRPRRPEREPSLAPINVVVRLSGWKEHI
jgi:hypothetical protein